jgi:hypothetical protein
MTIQYVGGLDLATAVPGASAAIDAGIAGINGALPDMQARIDALLAFNPQPVDFAAQLLLAQQTVASIQLGISLGIPAPSIASQIAQIAALIADLLATATAVQAQLQIITDLQTLFATGGVHAYAYAGDANDLGPEFTAELAGGLPGGGPTDDISALVLATGDSATWDAMGVVFKVTP